MSEQEQGLGQQTGLDQVLVQHEQARAKAQEDNVFVKIANHESVKLPFIGEDKVFVRQATGNKDGQSWNSIKVDFGLRAKTPAGEMKLWSISLANPIVPEVVALLKKGVKDITIHREGEGSSTRYSIQRERAI